MLQDPRAFRVLIDLFVYRYMRQRLDLVAGVDARGFIVGSVLAYELNLGFVPVRKKGKLPYRTVAEEYSLEYGNAAVEMHTDAVRTGQRVLLVDDLIATGGTMLAAIKLLQRLGANVVEAAAIIDLPDLGGSAKIAATGTRCTRSVSTRTTPPPDARRFGGLALVQTRLDEIQERLGLGRQHPRGQQREQRQRRQAPFRQHAHQPGLLDGALHRVEHQQRRDAQSWLASRPSMPTLFAASRPIPARVPPCRPNGASRRMTRRAWWAAGTRDG